MKRINIQVKVTYNVNMDCNVTEEELQALEQLCEDFPSGITDDDILSSDVSSTAFEWLNSNCKEGDAMSWSFEIEDLTEL